MCVCVCVRVRACVRACVRVSVCVAENVLCLDIIRTVDLALNTNNQAIADASKSMLCGGVHKSE